MNPKESRVNRGKAQGLHARITPAEAKQQLQDKGYSLRRAAPLIGRSYQWICQVLNGQQKSRPVLEAIAALPSAKSQEAA